MLAKRKTKVEIIAFSLLPTGSPGVSCSFPKISVTCLDDEAFSIRLPDEDYLTAVPGNSFGLGG
jgi:aspartate/methionine/tyrosine aminotransferase